MNDREYALRAARRSIINLNLIIDVLTRDQIEDALLILKGVEREAALIRRICEEAKSQ